MPYVFGYSHRLETHVAFDDDGNEVVLEDDEMDALRVFALREHLSDFDSKMELDDTTITVGRYRRPDGISPDEARAKVAWVRECLAEVKSVVWPGGTHVAAPELDKMTLNDLKVLGYNAIVVALRRDCPYQTENGHELVNLVYALIERDGTFQREKDYLATIREAWEGGEVKDRREWFSADHGQYRVLTDDEADDAWDEELDSYIDDCLEIPESIERYFDREKWKADARNDGRGHALSRYDGSEHRVDVTDCNDNEQTFYIYRTN